MVSTGSTTERAPRERAPPTLTVVPELPEVEALALDLKGRLADRAIVKIHIAAFSALKTFDPPLSALEGTLVDDVTRHGKFLDIHASGLHLVLHLARAGWIRWRDEVPPVPPKPSNKSPLAVRVVLDNQAGLDITEAGTKKSLAMYVVRDTVRRARHRQPRAGPPRRRLHPRRPARHPRARGPQAAQGRAPPPGHDRRHRQRLLRRAPARGADVAVQARQQPRRRPSCRRCTTRSAPCIGDAVERSRGLHASELKGEKKSHLAVHGQTGKPCPVCGDIVREVSFADSSLQYCATCQTGGKPLADRRLSKLLK